MKLALFRQGIPKIDVTNLCALGVWQKVVRAGTDRQCCSTYSEWSFCSKIME